MADYKLKVIIEGVDHLSGPFRGVQSVLGGIVSTAGGMLAAMGIQSLTQGLKDLAGQALQSYSDFERLGMTLTSLLGVEKMNATAGLSLADAMKQSSAEAKTLVLWAQNLAIFSPFTEDTVSKTLQTAMGYGMTSKMAQGMTQALADFGAGTGKSSQQTELLGLALGQVWAKGKLTGEEMRQLTNAGLGVGIMARAMGMDVKTLTAQMEKGQISAEKLIPAFIALSGKEFPDAAKNMSTSWAGLTSGFATCLRARSRPSSPMCRTSSTSSATPSSCKRSTTWVSSWAAWWPRASRPWAR
jgi:tape measure domain-containing protein